MHVMLHQESDKKGRVIAAIGKTFEDARDAARPSAPSVALIAKRGDRHFALIPQEGTDPREIVESARRIALSQKKFVGPPSPRGGGVA